jgi:hypothetical protein
MPHLLTMRVDDVIGGVWWAHTAVELGFKPWLGPFIGDASASTAADLRDLATNGNITVSVHAFHAGDFLYWDHNGMTNWSDSAQSNKFFIATQWHLTNGIPFAKIAVPHYAEAGSNAFPFLAAWGIEYLTMKNDPSVRREGPWAQKGPYRYFEAPQAGSTPLPLFYADFITVPGYPELNGRFFNCVTEIRDDDSCAEWCPNNDVNASVGRGTRQTKRAMDSLVLSTLFTHEFYIDHGPYTPITSNNWRTILTTITNNLSSYSPQCVTLDYACQYVRATRTARLKSSSFDTSSGIVTLNFNGSSDVKLQTWVFIGEDNTITNVVATIPPFQGGTSSSVVVIPPPSLVGSKMTTAGSFQFSFSSPPNLAYRVDASTDLMNWIALTQTSTTNGLFQFQDFDASNYARRFYRATWLP